MTKLALAVAIGLFPAFASALSLDELQSSAAKETLIRASRLQGNLFFDIRKVLIEDDGRSQYVHIQFHHRDLGLLQLQLKGRKGFLLKTDRSLKPLLMVTGFFTGKKSVKLLGAIPDNMVIAGFDYGYAIEDFLTHPAKIVEFGYKTPANVAAALAFLSQQPWANASELGYMGISLGGIFAPSSIRLSQEIGVPVSKTILGYTGGHVPAVLEHSLRDHLPAQVRRLFSHGMANLTFLLDPKVHLPHLKGRFLVLRASDEQVFPVQSSQILESLLPEPKKVVVIPGPHINENEKRMIELTRLEVLKWF